MHQFKKSAARSCQRLEPFLFKSSWMHFKLSRKTGYLLLHVQTIISEVDKDHNILQYLPWILNSQQKIFIEYIMLDGVNDQEENAHQLGELLKTFQVVKIFCFLIVLKLSAIIWCESLWRFLKKKQVINLIPFNPIGSTSQFKTSTKQSVSIFQKILRETYNIRTTVRKEMGQDISGACGQLVVNQPDNKRPAEPLRDIEDLHL